MKKARSRCRIGIEEITNVNNKDGRRRSDEKDDEIISKHDKTMVLFKSKQDRRFGISTRNNSMFKWQRKSIDKNSNETYMTIGALEVQSEPYLDYYKPVKPLEAVDGYEESFHYCIENIWEKLKLQKSFTGACESIPVETTCCGLVANDNKTKQNICFELSHYWSKEINNTLQSQKETKGYKVDVFLWTWEHICGSSESKILLIRFHKLL